MALNYSVLMMKLFIFNKFGYLRRSIDNNEQEILILPWMFHTQSFILYFFYRSSL